MWYIYLFSQPSVCTPIFESTWRMVLNNFNKCKSCSVFNFKSVTVRVKLIENVSLFIDQHCICIGKIKSIIFKVDFHILLKICHIVNFAFSSIFTANIFILKQIFNYENVLTLIA